MRIPFLSNRENRLMLLTALRFIPDKYMIALQFRLTMKKKLCLDLPRTFNEKLQWLKLHDRPKQHTLMVDKLKVREQVADCIGEDYLIPLLGVWECYEDIDFAELPDSFVLKCNHDSGSVKVINDKNAINHAALRRFFTRRLKNNPYYYGREWPYRDIKPYIIAEKNMSSADGALPADYKFFCFDGHVDSVMICTDRGFSSKRFFFYDKNWKLQKYNKSSQELPNDYQIHRPPEIDQLFALAATLSQGERFVRIDFYIIDGHPYFGEYTFFPASGYDNNLLPWADEKLGSLIQL